MKLNIERINSKFSDIQKGSERLEKFHKIEREAFLSNDDNIHIARSHLLIAIEASISICFHIAAKKLKRTAEEYSSCFKLLQENNILSKRLSDFLISLVGLRNKMVHRYEEIDYGFVFDNFKPITENLQKLIEEVSKLMEE